MWWQVRRLLLAIQDLTAERDQAREDAAKARAAAAAGEDPEETQALHKQLTEARAENANMFTLMAENEALRAEVHTLRLRLECLEGEPNPIE